jgi:hypothetical protein
MSCSTFSGGRDARDRVAWVVGVCEAAGHAKLAQIAVTAWTIGHERSKKFLAMLDETAPSYAEEARARAAALRAKRR